VPLVKMQALSECWRPLPYPLFRDHLLSLVVVSVNRQSSPVPYLAPQRLTRGPKANTSLDGFRRSSEKPSISEANGHLQPPLP